MTKDDAREVLPPPRDLQELINNALDLDSIGPVFSYDMAKQLVEDLADWMADEVEEEEEEVEDDEDLEDDEDDSESDEDRRGSELEQRHDAF